MTLTSRMPSLLRALALAATLACGATSLVAQSSDVIPDGALVTFSQLASAPFQTSHQADRVRRFLDGAGQLVQVREQVTLAANGRSDSPFKLDFVDLVGSGAPDATVRTKWNEIYRSNAGLLHMHGGFHVTDPVLAQQNYQIFDFGRAQRLGRDVRRVVVFPLRADKPIWLLDLDVVTGVTLYAAEFDSQLRLIGELETTALVVSSSMQLDRRRSMVPVWSWRPKMIVSRVATIQDATALYGGAAPTQPAIGGVVGEYRQHLVQVTEDPVNGDKTLVLGYTDGVDEFFVLQSRGGGNPFASNVAIASATSASSHAIASCDDQAMRAYVFHESGTTYWVVGSGSLVRLKDVAFRLCQQSVTGR